jgi:hypothetical protein
MLTNFAIGTLAGEQPLGGELMLARLILLLVQLGVGWFGAPHILRYLPKFGGAVDIFVFAVVVALLVTVVGFVGSLILQGVGTPTTGTLTSSLVFALIFAGLTLVEPVVVFVDGLVPGLRPSVYPLIGAVLGYFIKR